MDFWPQTLAEWMQVAQAGGLLGAAGWALYTFRKQLKLRAADILMQVEQEFRSVQPTLDRIENLRVYRERYGPVLRTVNAEGAHALDDAGVATLQEVDRCLRFFYFCTTLNRHLGVDEGALAKAYYFYLRVIADAAERPELAAYLEHMYPNLHAWAAAHRGVAAQQDGGPRAGRCGSDPDHYGRGSSPIT